jgi:hypothetical protein
MVVTEAKDSGTEHYARGITDAANQAAWYQSFFSEIG